MFCFFFVIFLNFGNPQKENWWEESFIFFFFFLNFLNFLNFRDGPNSKNSKNSKKKWPVVFFPEFFEFWQSSKRKLVGRVLFFFEFVEFFEFFEFSGRSKIQKIQKIQKKPGHFF